MPLFHIHGLVAALLASLSSGGSVVCTPGMDPGRFLSWARDAGATWYTAVPTIHHAVLTAARADPTIPDGLQFRFVRSSSAALAPSLLADLEATFGVPVVEAYGMTEAAHQMASNPLPPAIRKPGTVGLAAGPEVTILDESGRELPRGCVGEIAVRGPNVMSGYVANPEANAAAFEGGWFRTGDQGVIDADGYVTITGRLKELINRGGEKISPREVDEVLLEHPAVEQVVTFAVAHPTLGEDVAAAVVLCDQQVSDAELRAFARERLSLHKVPRRFVRLDEIPKGPTGKIQRIGFAERISVVHEDVTTSGTPLEAAVGGLWREVLGVEHLGPDDDFFSLGGDSLRAMELVAAASDVFGVELAVRDVFEEAVTVRGMATWIETARREGHKSAPFSDPPPCDTSQPAVSLAQEREWFLAALTPDQPVGNVTLAMRLHGPLQHDRLARALNELVARHDMLRARFTLAAGRPEIEVTAVGRVPFHVHAPADLSTIEAEASARAAEPIDLTVAPLLRVHLYPVAHSRTEEGEMNEDHVLLVVAHHIVADGWTRGILRNELAALYAGDTLPPPPVGYLELAATERAGMAAGTFDGDLRWWAEHFDPVPEPLLLPADRRRPPRLDLRTQTVMMQLDEELSAEVRAFAAREGVTLFMTLLAAFETLVARHTGRSDFAIGVLTNGRQRAQSHEVVGLFAGTVPLRATVDADVTFRELLARVRAECLDVFDRQVPMQLIVDAVHPPRRADLLPLVQVLFQLRNLPPVTSTMGDVRLETLDIPTGANAAELECDVIDDGAALSVRCEFSSAAFDAATIEQLLGRFEMLLRHAVAAPDTPVGRLDVLTAHERAVLDGFGRGPALTPTTRRADEMLATRASEAPDAIALVAGEERLTYGELDRSVNRIARYLHAEGVAPGAVVGLCLRREAVMVAAVPRGLASRLHRGTARPIVAGGPDGDGGRRTRDSTPPSFRRRPRNVCRRSCARSSSTTPPCAMRSPDNGTAPSSRRATTSWRTSSSRPARPAARKGSRSNTFALGVLRGATALDGPAVGRRHLGLAPDHVRPVHR